MYMNRKTKNLMDEQKKKLRFLSLTADLKNAILEKSYKISLILSLKPFKAYFYNLARSYPFLLFGRHS